MSNVARHRKSKKHKDANYINNEIFEIKRIKEKPNTHDKLLIIK